MAEQKYVDWDGLVYYDGKNKEYIRQQLTNLIKLGGEVTFEELHVEKYSPSFDNLNYIYKITNEFVADDWFESSIRGNIYPAGTWIMVAEYNLTYLYTIFSEPNTNDQGEVDLTPIYSEIDSLKNTDIKIKSDIQTINAKFSDYATTDQFDELSNEINSNNSKIADIEVSVDDNSESIEEINNKLDAIEDAVSDNKTTLDLIIETNNEQSEAIDELTESISKINSKIDNISFDTSGLATKEEVVAVEAKVDAIVIPEVPIKVSELENDAGYITLENLPDEKGKIFAINVTGYSYNTVVTPEEDVALSYLYDSNSFDSMRDPSCVVYIKDSQLDTYWRIVSRINAVNDPEDHSQVYGYQYLYLECGPALDSLDEKSRISKCIYEFRRFWEESGDVGEWRFCNSNIIDTSTIATEQFVKDSIDAINIPETDLSNYYNKTETETLVNEAVKDIEHPSELFVVDFNAPDFAAALEAYNNGKLLLLTNAAPDGNGYAVMNYVRDDMITFTKFLMSRSETYGAFNTYYLHSDNTWELAKEVKLNKVEATVNENDDIVGLTIGKNTYDFDNFATTEVVNQITEDINTIENTYVTNQTLEENYITIADGVTKQDVNVIVETQVEAIVKEEIETTVETIIQEKVDAGEITVATDAITYGEF